MRNITPILHVEKPGTLRAERRGSLLRLVAEGDWVTADAPQLDQELTALDRQGASEAEIDGSAIAALDSAGLWLLLRTRHALETSGARIKGFVVPERYASLLATLERESSMGRTIAVRRRHGLEYLLERTGKGTIHALRQGYDMVGFLGRVTVETVEAVLAPRRELPFPALIH